MLYGAEELRQGFVVETVGFRREKLPADAGAIVENCGKPVESADYLILPPVTVDAAGHVPAPYGENSIQPEELLKRVRAGGIVFGGNDRGVVRGMCRERDLGFVDYINSIALAEANAVPTAEGAIKIALEETGRTIWGSRVLVTGCGRIGTALALRLRALGADVTAAARREETRVHMRTMGMKAAAIPLEESLGAYDVVFNTVPEAIFSEALLCTLRADSPLIELASKPGGAEPGAAEKSGCRYVWASGLPPAVTG